MVQKTLKPGTIFCSDNLPILRGIDSNSIDMIYLDPPFNKGQNFHAPIGTTAEGAEFKDIWSPEDVKDEWHNQIADKQPELYKYLEAVGGIGSRSAKYYLIYMAVRLMEMHRILKPTGTLYLHCDQTASHYLKLLLDTIFGTENFMNDFTWCYNKMPAPSKSYQRNHDNVLVYAKTPDKVFNVVRREPTESSLRTYENAKKKGYNANRKKKMVTVFDWDKYDAAVASGDLPDDLKPVEFQEQGVPMQDWIEIPILSPNSKERTGYPTQKPTSLISKFIESSTNRGDIVLDPFCGCATTCIAAEKLQRKWIGIDVSEKAYDLVRMRLDKELPSDLVRPKPIFREDIPERTDSDYKRKITKEDRFLMFGEQNAKCNGCRKSFEIQSLEVDHVVASSLGGGNERDNLQLLCSNCNRIKGDRPMEYLKVRLKQLHLLEDSTD